jgi:hypothetical protein
MGAKGSAISSSAKRLSTVFGHIDHEGDGAAGRAPRHGVLPCTSNQCTKVFVAAGMNIILT